NDSKKLQIMLKTAGRRCQLAHAGIEHVLACVPERSMAQVMRQRDGLGEVFMQTQVAGQRTGNLRDLYAVCQPCAEQITFVIDENLGFVLKQPEGIAMDDTITIALEGIASHGRGLGVQTPTRAVRV